MHRHLTLTVIKLVDYLLENYTAVDSKFPPNLWAKPADLLFPYTNNGAESYHSHMNEEFYVKHTNIYVFVDVLKKIQQWANVSINSMSQQARKSKYERDKRVCNCCILWLSFTSYHKKWISEESVNREPNCDWQCFNFWDKDFIGRWLLLSFVRFHIVFPCVFIHF